MSEKVKQMPANGTGGGEGGTQGSPGPFLLPPPVLLVPKRQFIGSVRSINWHYDLRRLQDHNQTSTCHVVASNL